MSHVNVSIDGRQYRMACDEGQEPHLQSLAEDLDKRIVELRENFGDIGDFTCSDRDGGAHDLG